MNDSKLRLDNILAKHKVQPAGSGYIDCVVTKENLADFLADLDGIGIDIAGVSMWCHCTDENTVAYGCPHGSGGPPSKYHGGYFSEMGHMEFKNEIDSNADVLEYVFSECLNDEFYSPCLHPGIWLNVPEDWKNADHIAPPEEDEEVKIAKQNKAREKEIGNMVLLVSIASLLVNGFFNMILPLPPLLSQVGFVACGIICGILGLRMKIRHANEEFARGKKIREFMSMFFQGLAVYLGVSILFVFVLLIVSC